MHGTTLKNPARTPGFPNRDISNVQLLDDLHDAVRVRIDQHGPVGIQGGLAPVAGEQVIANTDWRTPCNSPCASTLDG